jgi:hypothetical protein
MKVVHGWLVDHSNRYTMRSEVKRRTEANILIAVIRHTTIHLFAIPSFVTYIGGDAEASRYKGSHGQ